METPSSWERIMNYGTRKDEHNKLFDRFVKEMFASDTTEKKSYKPKTTLQSTRSKFLQRIKEQKKRDPGDIV